MGKKEIIIGVFLALLSVVFFALTYQFPAQTLAFSPKIFPRFVSVCLFIISIVLVVQGISAGRRRLRERKPEPTAGGTLNKSFLIRLSAGILIGYAYTQLLPVMGYVTATPPFIAAIMIIFNEKRWLMIVATSIVTAGLLYILFRIIFKVPLPRFSLF